MSKRRKFTVISYWTMYTKIAWITVLFIRTIWLWIPVFSPKSAILPSLIPMHISSIHPHGSKFQFSWSVCRIMIGWYGWTWIFWSRNFVSVCRTFSCNQRTALLHRPKRISSLLVMIVIWHDVHSILVYGQPITLHIPWKSWATCYKAAVKIPPAMQRIGSRYVSWLPPLLPLLLLLY